MNIDLLSVFIGGLTVFAVCIAVFMIQRHLHKKGKVKIFAKTGCNQTGGQSVWGFRAGDSGVTLHVPIKLTFQNDTNKEKIFRDMNLLLYKCGALVSEMDPIQRFGHGDNELVYGDNGSYSTIVSAKRVHQFTFYFLLHKDSRASQNFDQLILRYYDENDMAHLLMLGNFDGDWTIKDFPRLADSEPLREHGAPNAEKELLMNEEKLAFMQLIQEPISRMSTISAIFKGFAATIVAGISALSYSNVNLWVLGLSFLPVLAFAVMDMYYLKLEKGFRYLYKLVRLDLRRVDFNVLPYPNGINESSAKRKEAKISVWDLLISPSIYLFYPLLVVILIVVFVMKYKGLL